MVPTTALISAAVSGPFARTHTCTCLPMQATPKGTLTQEELEALTKRTQEGGTEVVQAKAGKVSG